MPLWNDRQIFQADPDAKYYSRHSYDLGTLEPVVAKPHSPDNRDLARNCRHIKIDRVYIGSCTGMCVPFLCYGSFTLTSCLIGFLYMMVQVVRQRTLSRRHVSFRTTQSKSPPSSCPPRAKYAFLFSFLSSNSLLYSSAHACVTVVEADGEALMFAVGRIFLRCMMTCTASRSRAGPWPRSSVTPVASTQRLPHVLLA